MAGLGCSWFSLRITGALRCSCKAKDVLTLQTFLHILAVSLGFFGSTKSQMPYSMHKIYGSFGHSTCHSRRKFCLSTQHFFSNRFPIFSPIRSFSGEEFIGDYPNCIKISTEGMILPQQNLGCHVSWRPTSFIGIFCPPKFSDAEVSNPRITIFIKYDIFRLDISMDDASPM